jgi:drug/metabolite transporter (DMT)-like permease
MFSLGIISALATALCWATCAMFLTPVSRRVGVLTMNNWRVLLGAIMLLAAHIATQGNALPQATGTQWTILIASGLMGVFIGDTFLFQSFHDIGPRLGLLILNITPFLTAFLAWPILGEELPLSAWIGMAVTVGGTTWVVIEEHRGDPDVRAPHYFRGVICAILASAACAIGYVIAKPMMTGNDGVLPLSAALIRVGSAVVAFWFAAMVRGRIRDVIAVIRMPKQMFQLMGGSISGPFLGIWLSMFAIKLIPAGIASTLFATMPVLILPMVMIAYKEKVSWRAAIGAAIAVLGVAILYLF